MFILRDLLLPLQAVFSNTAQGQKRKVWFVYTLLAVVVPFTLSIISNLLRCLADSIWFKAEKSALLCLHGEPDIAMEKAMACHVGNDSVTGCRRTNCVSTGRFDEPKEWEKNFWLRTFSRPCRKG